MNPNMILQRFSCLCKACSADRGNSMKDLQWNLMLLAPWLWCNLIYKLVPDTPPLFSTKTSSVWCIVYPILLPFITTSLVRITSWVSATTHFKSRVNAVIKYTCEWTITWKIRAGCELGCANISCWCDCLFQRYDKKQWVKLAEIHSIKSPHSIHHVNTTRLLCMCVLQNFCYRAVVGSRHGECGAVTANMGSSWSGTILTISQEYVYQLLHQPKIGYNTSSPAAWGIRFTYL